MVSAKDVINSTKPNLTKVPTGPTKQGSAGYDNARDDIEKVKKMREGSVEKVPVFDNDIVNKKYVDDSVAVENLWDRAGTTLSPHTAEDDVSFRDLKGARYADFWGFDVTVGGFGSSKAWFDVAGNLDFSDNAIITGVLALDVDNLTVNNSFTMGDAGTIYAFSSPEGRITWDAGSSRPLHFRDSGISISSDDDGYLDLKADIGIRLNRTTTLGTNAEVTKNVNFRALAGSGLYNHGAIYSYGLDDTANESAWFDGRTIPNDMKAGTDIKIYLYWFPKITQIGGVAKDVVFRFIHNTMREGVAMGGDVWEASFADSCAINETADTLHRTLIKTLSGYAANDLLGLRIYRHATAGTDTVIGDMCVVSADLEYTADKLGE